MDVHVLETQPEHLATRHIQLTVDGIPIKTRYKEPKHIDPRDPACESKGGICFLRETKANDIPISQLPRLQVNVSDSEVIYHNDLASIGKAHGWPAGASLTYEMCKQTLTGIQWNDAEQWIYYPFVEQGFIIKFDYDDDGFDSEIFCVKGYDTQGIVVDTVHRNDTKRTHYFGVGMKQKNQSHAGVSVVQSAKLDDLPDRYINNILFYVKRLTGTQRVELGQCISVRAPAEY